MSQTYELRILFPANAAALKEDVKNFLIGEGEEAFVEGIVDDVELASEFGLEDHTQFEKLGGNESPLSLFSYERAHLQGLQKKLAAAFGSRLTFEEHASDTAEWQEGWKQGFRPFATQRFWVYPPWEAESCPTGKLPLEVDPGMAFGTGQHETTQLCLAAIERYAESAGSLSALRALDVGTGSGILAIAMAKLGFKEIVATDIDDDALRAAKANAEVNGVNLTLQAGSCPRAETYPLVVANILAIVLTKLAPELARCVASGGILVLSGLLTTQKEDVRHAFEACGLTFKASAEQGDWASLTLERR